MPELPEVETTRLGVSPYLKDAIVTQVIIRQFSLRWPIAAELADILTGQTIFQIQRRAKYLLLHCNSGTLIIHLGMSGRLRIVDIEAGDNDLQKHDHVDITLDNGHLLRYTDPRRFGAILWTSDPIEQHPLLVDLGPEPLTEEFTADYLWQRSQSRCCSIKTLIMNGKVVVGVGNIYANEALFLAELHPKSAAKNLTFKDHVALVAAIKNVLNKAISAGGTTLKDFRKSDGKPGYFAQELNVYGRAGSPCPRCESIIQHYKETQRATFYCPLCQPTISD
ncbi:MAG: bifunctional DNA-formamidopyrimidine glycosylase/DNA-(apurinic or apyrimidinic site) lyase [Gammaproteobacteria bacterium]|nr:bifunctional DNA-formamidopyrimidine glycosylase/DNA-(apurinic or apyrimidinic site) lyase [Gammaproteobacteria bacterium]MDH5592403.1 bifunctional DNA-formamidopyrimidine glycosylase/DNA-(apurinic or apyrimidinic site) lyase [Gammaproteobacteria bacterium]